MIEVLSCGPMATLQDGGRPGWLGRGLSRGGAADRAARAEAAALLDGDPGAGIELPGVPLRLRLHADAFLALTGAPCAADADGRALPWHAAVPHAAGTTLRLKPGRGGYAYLHVAGGFDAPELLGGQGAHLTVGIGRALAPGDTFGHGSALGAARRLAVQPDRFEGGTLRIVETPQTRLFPEAERRRLEETAFTRHPSGDRRGVRLAMDGPGFRTEGQLSLLSDFVLPGDVQMTGDGVPYILGPECQTTGGYPRIGSVIPADLPRAMQAPPGAPLRLRFVALADARAAAPGRPATEPLVRAPGDDPDLMARQLIGGVVSAKEGEA